MRWMSETTVADGVCQLPLAGGRWLATGFDGGYADADAAYNVSVPVGFDRTDLDAYVETRLNEAGFRKAGPKLLTGVDMAHACGASHGSVTVVATAGISNPASLPVGDDGHAREATGSDDTPLGTVNLLVGTTRALADGALATLLATAVEAKAATLQQLTGYSGTTTDAVAVGCDPTGTSADFAGSATAVGRATRVCVRDAVRESLDARYPEGDYPDSVADAEHGVLTTERATLFDPKSGQ